MCALSEAVELCVNSPIRSNSLKLASKHKQRDDDDDNNNNVTAHVISYNVHFRG